MSLQSLPAVLNIFLDIQLALVNIFPETVTTVCTRLVYSLLLVIVTSLSPPYSPLHTPPMFSEIRLFGKCPV